MASQAREAEVGGASLCARLTREVLGRLAAPEVRDGILAAALRDADLPAIPDDPPGFGAFASGPLHDAIEEVLGTDAASAIITDLSPAFAETASSSGVRRRRGASFAPPRGDAPVVLVASADPAEVEALVERLKDHAKVIAAFDMFTLLAAAGRDLAAPLTLLLNDAMPAARPSTLASLGRVLPPGSRIIVWGAGGAVPEPSAREPFVEWVALGPVADAEAIIGACMDGWSVRIRTSEPAQARRVVLAHDDASWRARVSRMLGEAGYVVLSAPDGFMALERCIDERPNAVVAGLEMETLDGAQLAALLRRRFGDEGPPVLLVADGPLPEPPAGAAALIRSDAIDEDLVPELAAWIGLGTLEG